jgi:TIR domain
MPGIFISYRRDDTAGHVGRLSDRLGARFGAEQVFVDVDAILPGQDFIKVLNQKIAGCDALIAVIGKEWLSIEDEMKRRRLDDPGDYVALELAEALKRGIPIIPVLVEGATMPRERDLPESLKGLVRYQALTISDERFHAETDDLIRALEATVAAGGTARKPSGGRGGRRLRWLVAGAVSIAVAAAGLLAWKQLGGVPPELSGRWTAAVPIDQTRSFRIMLDLETAGDRVLGTVSYPTGVGGIRDGTIRGNRVSFETVHTPQFEYQEAVIRFEGKIEGQELHMVMQDSQSVHRFTAVRAKPK